MGISQYIKEIGRGPRGAKPLTREQATDLFGQVLDGTVTDLEIGAFCLAMRIKGETADEMCGFLDATHAAPGAAARQRPPAGGAAQLQRGAQAAGAHAAAGAAAGARGPAGAAARHAHRSAARPGLRRARSAGRGRRSQRRAQVADGEVATSTPSCCTRGWRACWPCARRWACATPGTASSSS